MHCQTLLGSQAIWKENLEIYKKSPWVFFQSTLHLLQALVEQTILCMHCRPMMHLQVLMHVLFSLFAVPISVSNKLTVS